MIVSQAPDVAIKAELSAATVGTVIAHAIMEKQRNPSVIGRIQCRSLIDLTWLLHEVDSRALTRDVSLATIASQDRLFLTHHNNRFPITKGIASLRSFMDVTAALLNGIHLMSDKNYSNHISLASLAPTYGDFRCVKFLANMEHLVLSLQKTALDAIVRYLLELVEDSVLRWYQFWLHRKGAIDDWFAEWPNGHRPLNTTWPWNIKTALLVLWGVCWMFYDNGRIAPENPDALGTSEQDMWTRQAAIQSQLLQQPQTSVAWTGPAIYPNYSWLHPHQAGALARRASDRTPANTLPAYRNNPTAYQYISTLSYEPSDLVSDPSPVGWPYTSAINIAQRPALDSQESLWQCANIFSAPSANIRQRRDPITAPQPYVVPPAGPSPATSSGTSNRQGFYPLIQRRNMQDYPSPELSDVSGPVNPTYPAFESKTMNSPSVPLVASPSISGSSTSRISTKRDREPQRNEGGAIYCDHADCANAPPVFARKCEWSKHMDKHTRPYICEEPGCENIRGFTYSGGLLRHQREVHRQHGGPKASCMCPHKDCKRSTGVGFSRRENLQEHLRRVHRDIDPESRQGAVAAAAAATMTLTTDQQQAAVFPGSQTVGSTRKRRRRIDSDDKDNDDGNGYGDENPWGLKQQVKKLRAELRERDERLKKLEERFEELARSHRI